MERSETAIEKARLARKSQSGSELNTTQNTSGPESTTGRFSTSKKSAINVQYSQTRRESPSEYELEKHHIIAGIPNNKKAEPYRQLRSRILKKMRAEGWRSLAITSPTQDNGKTLTAINLAIAISMDVNQTVMLVDLDLRNPSIAEMFCFGRIEYGITDCLDGSVDLADILINPGFERLVVLPGTPQDANTSEILTSPAMGNLRDEIYQRYDDRFIIYDLPALLNNDDALVFTPQADATLLVVGDGDSSQDDIERSISLLRDTNLIGYIVNKVR